MSPAFCLIKVGNEMSPAYLLIKAPEAPREPQARLNYHLGNL